MSAAGLGMRLPALVAGETAAEHLRNAMQLLLEAERGRAIVTVENDVETIRLGMCLLPDPAFRAIGARLLAALDQLEGRSCAEAARSTVLLELTPAGIREIDGCKVLT